MSGFSEFNENSVVQIRDDSSGHRIVKVSAEAETVIGPGRTPEISAGTMLATQRTGIKKMSDRIFYSDPLERQSDSGWIPNYF